MKTKKYTFSPQNGKPGYCVCAQVFDENGDHLATIKSTKVAKDASETAKLFSKSLEMLEALKGLYRLRNLICYDPLTTKAEHQDEASAIYNAMKQIDSLLKELG